MCARLPHISQSIQLWASANAVVAGVSIIPRASWGADEWVRYQDSSTWKKYYENLEKTKNDPISAAALKAQEHTNALEFYIATNYTDMYTSVETIREEWGHKLVWPIERTKKVEKIVIHHTAENNLKDLSDEELIRSTYYYHAVNRGWGDIGYNYVVGQRGQIYEWRAGGDYSVGAHAAWNNRSTVGVSVIGNFWKWNGKRRSGNRAEKDYRAAFLEIRNRSLKKFSFP